MSRMLSPDEQARALIEGNGSYPEEYTRMPEFQSLVDYLGESSAKGEANWRAVQAALWRRDGG